MKIIIITLAFISLGLGIVGIIFPILPTTPFLLLTTYMLSKSSKRFHDWFTNTIIYTKYLSNFIETKSMTKKQKWSLLIFVDIILLVSFFSIDSLFLKILIILIFLFKHYYFYRYIEIKN
ncbi:MAG: YbaN family protein [Candidatus Izimaplasma sp.]|nr:YbaN family protein [Candidatus Izimaplasma bacterium]